MIEGTPQTSVVNFCFYTGVGTQVYTALRQCTAVAADAIGIDDSLNTAAERSGNRIASRSLTGVVPGALRYPFADKVFLRLCKRTSRRLGHSPGRVGFSNHFPKLAVRRPSRFYVTGGDDACVIGH